MGCFVIFSEFYDVSMNFQPIKTPLLSVWQKVILKSGFILGLDTTFPRELSLNLAGTGVVANQ